MDIYSEERQILDSLKQETVPVVIYGALQSDEAIIAACNKLGIKIVCICDDSKRKAGNIWCGLQVYSFYDVIAKYEKVAFIVNISYLKPIVKKIEEAGSRWYSCKCIVHSDAFRKLSGIEEIEYDRTEAERACFCHDNYLLPDKLYMSNVDVVVTERCSLRCRDCANLMQFYEKPNDYATGEVVNNIEKLINVVDGIYELRFIGGEPFMNRELHTIMKPFLKTDKVKNLLIYTNGTILPRQDQWEVFSDSKIVFMITNYGEELSRNFDKIIQKLKEHSIKYHVLRMDYWNPCDTFDFHERTKKEQINIFKNCCVKNYVTLIRDRLYRCPYSAHAMNLHAVPWDEHDYFRLIDMDNISEAKGRLKDYLFEIDGLNTCNYCNSRAFDSDLIPVAVQCGEPRKYYHY